VAIWSRFAAIAVSRCTTPDQQVASADRVDLVPPTNSNKVKRQNRLLARARPGHPHVGHRGFIENGGIFNFQLNVFSYLPCFNVVIFHLIWKPRTCASAERTSV
jgi:hypothetical protein